MFFVSIKEPNTTWDIYDPPDSYLAVLWSKKNTPLGWFGIMIVAADAEHAFLNDRQNKELMARKGYP